MKIVKESIGFQRGIGAKKSIGIGIYTTSNFKTIQEAADFVINNLAEIIGADGIPVDVINPVITPQIGYEHVDPRDLWNQEYFGKIDAYISEFIEVGDTFSAGYWFIAIRNELARKLVNMGYGRK